MIFPLLSESCVFFSLKHVNANGFIPFDGIGGLKKENKNDDVG